MAGMKMTKAGWKGKKDTPIAVKASGKPGKKGK